MTLLELNYQRRETWRKANDALDRAATEGRTLTIPEQVQFDALVSRIAELDRFIAERESLRKLAQ